MEANSTFDRLIGQDTLPEYRITDDEKTLGAMAHIITLLSSFIAPLIIYLIKKDESRFVAHHAKEALNFQITALLVFVALFISLIGILLMWIWGIAVFIWVIIATIKAAEGRVYRYPFCLRIIK